MKTIDRFAAIVAFLVLSSSSLHARIGESLRQCDDRYGEVLFKNAKGELEYRSYRFKGKKIRVVFYKSESVEEQITSGPHPVSGQEQGVKFTSEFNLFFQALLSSTYHFTDDQITELSPWRRTGKFEMVSRFIANGDLRAGFSVVTTESNDSLRFMGFIMKKLTAPNLRTINDFLLDSMEMEDNFQEKSQEKERVNGF